VPLRDSPGFPSRPPVARLAAALAVCACACWPLVARSQAIVPSTLVQVVPGANAVALEGTLKGPNLGARDYVVRLEGGRTMRVALETKSPDTGFAVLDPYGGTIHRNQANRGNSWSGRLPEPGEYRVRVTLSDEAAQRAAGAAYTLRISVER